MVNSNGNSDISITVGQDLVKPILEQKIKMAILESFDKKEQVLDELIRQVLLVKVDRAGNPTRSSYEEVGTLLDFHFKSAIINALKESVKEFADEHKQEIKLELARQLKSKKGVSSFVSSIMTGIIDNIDNKWPKEFIIKLNQFEKED
jgi:hypothetical protein